MRADNLRMASFPCHADLAVHRLGARQAHHVVAATDDIALKTIMANQISAVIHHLYQVTFSGGGGTAVA